MGLENVEAMLSGFLSSFAETYGTGDILVDSLAALSAVALLFAVLSLLVAMRSSRQKPAPAPEQFPVGGRLEKLERSINEFRTDTLRSLALMRQELSALRGEKGVKPEAETEEKPIFPEQAEETKPAEEASAPAAVEEEAEKKK